MTEVDFDFELIIIKSLFSNEVVRNKVVPLLDEKWFNNDINASKIAEKIIEFYRKQTETPMQIRNSIQELSWKNQMKQVIDSVFPSKN